MDRVIITPSGPRGDKEYAFQKDIRRRLIEIFASEFDDDRVEVDFTFLDSSSETTTLGMDHHYQDRFGESPFQVFGADVSRAMASWPHAREQKEYLLMRLPKIFLSRPGSDLDLEDK